MSTLAPVRVRFAPSPTGQLHLGGLRTALYNFLFARSHGGSFVLRIEDTDQTRLVAGAAEKLQEVLDWAGITVDEGPLEGGPLGPYRQSERLNIYHEKIKPLLENGSAYRCFCTGRRLDMLRREALQRGETPKYDNKCRHLTEGEREEKLASGAPHVIRFKLEHQEDPWTDLVYGDIVYDVASVEGDPVLIKTDGFPTYHFANVVDDHLMKISHVLRGVEWQTSTPKHLLLYKSFGWTPPAFAHLPLLLNKDGKKLSKRQGDVHVESYINRGYFPEALLSLLTSMGAGFRMNDPAKCKDMNERIRMFDLSCMKPTSSRMDFDKLLHYSQYHLKRKLENKEERAQIVAEVQKLVSRKAESSSLGHLWDEEYILRALSWSKDHLKCLPDILEPYFDFIWSSPNLTELKTINLDNKTLVNILQAVVNSLDNLSEDDFVSAKISETLRSNPAFKKFKFSEVMKALRVCLSGFKQGPSVAEMMWVIGKPQTTSRVEEAIKYCS
ncbi:hypothetical protein CAPTEDRAFT_170963 [Capitella teleta]|uniref:Nondiscriminating glutamyl-tRNA synthetase EARS2, mitochondrial n=1 Tax=Capitella teleta TaxID=283909 RepID=R7U1B9_CAPTE|nr:hypothetical protein CAPTEDRAFT_170963 [Capitella teleta]|eukprot:ELT97441.1 hypothetical protein CAPTEDRAFT_170963 [Capitella teleta]